MGPGTIAVLMFAIMLSLMALGLPIAFVLGGTAMLFALFLWGPAAVQVAVLNASNTMNATVLVAVPLFIFMAYMLEKSGIADELFTVVHRWMGSLRGGLAAGVIVGCTIIAAMTGISSTGVLMMGIIGLPAMLSRNYDKHLAMGCIMAGGALGPLIPPSIVMIVYALISGESVGRLFLGGILPGLLLSTLFISYILIRCYFNKDLGPALPFDERAGWGEKLRSLKGIILPVLLVFAVLGSIFGGLATPTEAAAVGAFGTMVSAAVHGHLRWGILKAVTFSSLKTVAMIMWIIFAANCFAAILQGLGVSALLKGMLVAWPVNKWIILILIQITWFILGCLMDALSIMLVSMPVFFPVITFLGIDPLWFGILYVVNTEMGYLTPPFGVNLFVMRGIAPKEISTLDIYRAAGPFILLQAAGLILTMAFPGLATYLPNLILKTK